MVNLDNETFYYTTNKISKSFIVIMDDRVFYKKKPQQRVTINNQS